MTELAYLLALRKLPKIGDVKARKLLQHYGSAEDVFYALQHKDRDIHGFIDQMHPIQQYTKYIEDAFVEAEKIKDLNLDYVSINQSSYPWHLSQCEDAPALLFYKGNINWRPKRSIAIVGTRRATNYGLGFCRELVQELKYLDVQIVSGLAYGIDIQAHKAAIDFGLETIACLAHGLHTISPMPHKRYVEDIIGNGGLVTEFSVSDPIDKVNFVKRNRIIAGLTHATVVIESPRKGGSMHTAGLANSYNREVFALPGRAGDTYSEGCNLLIKSNQARLIDSVADLIYILNWDLGLNEKPAPQIPLFIDLNPDEEKLVNILKEKESESLDLLSLNSGINLSKTAALLLGLELKGVIKPLPGKHYQLI